MLNFPVPYQDELIFSLVARAGIHAGLTSPKQLLDEVFSNRHVIATVDLPNHLASLVGLLPLQAGYSVEQLAYSHTLFPIYAPFVTETNRLAGLQSMATLSQGSLHSRLGVAASRLNQLQFLRYCPQCLIEQKKIYGEYFWQREWQVVGANSCPKHGELLETEIERHSLHRHQFVAASPDICPLTPQNSANSYDTSVAQQVIFLLNRPMGKSPDFSQWNSFYHSLAIQAGCTKKVQIRHEYIHEQVLSRWSSSWLSQHGLSVGSNGCTDWLQSIFRKHRKAFSYLEHIVVLESFLPSSWRIQDVIDEVCSINLSVVVPVLTIQINASEQQLTKYRQLWQSYLASGESVKGARLKHQDVYAWLYRHDKAWLLEFNKKFHQGHSRGAAAIDWTKRDLNICRQLIQIRNQHEMSLDAPRMSRNWYLSNFPSSSMIEKNIHKMPLTSMFFQKNCEDIAEYQIRRLAVAYSLLSQSESYVKRWMLLRASGLSDDRLQPLTKALLDILMRE